MKRRGATAAIPAGFIRITDPARLTELESGRRNDLPRRVDRSRCVHPDCPFCHETDRLREGLEFPPPVRGPFTDVCGCRYCGCRWAPTAGAFRGGYAALSAWLGRYADSYTRLPLVLSWEPKLSRRLFLRLLGNVWVDSDNIEHPKYLGRVLALLPDRSCSLMMSPEERTALKALPETVVVYRGADAAGIEGGPSWSLDRRVAAAFPFLMRYRAASPILLTGSVRRTRICAVKLERQESEVISKHVVITGRERLADVPILGRQVRA